jgi:hypothetical protein
MERRGKKHDDEDRKMPTISWEKYFHPSEEK